MSLTMLAKDEDSRRSGCPSVYRDDDDPAYAVVQAPELDAGTRADLVNLLPGETGVRIKISVLAAALARLQGA